MFFNKIYINKKVFQMANLEIQEQSTLESELEANIKETKSELNDLNETIQKESDIKSVEKI
jgi:hypothetical protein